VKPELTAAPATTGTTVEYQVRFATGTKGARRMKAAGETAPTVKALPTPTVAPALRPTAPPHAVPEPVHPRRTAKPSLPVVTRPSHNIA
jgi:hypothetical protein